MEAENGTAAHKESVTVSDQPCEDPHHQEQKETKGLLQQWTETEAQHQSAGKKVLIAIDCSKCSNQALLWYAKKLHSPGDQILFINVAEPPEMALGFGMAGVAAAEIYTKAMEETVASAKRLASNVKQTCRSLGIEKFRFLERIGHGAGQAIVEIADEEQVDLIVLGSRGAGLLRRTFIGSVSDYVLHHSRHAAVTVVPASMLPLPCAGCRRPECGSPSSCSATSTAEPSRPDTKQE